ncbi:alpha-1,2-fucosyltransferase [uncultured Maribacter sp.]|uniref:alpha-1,2-fucosyltransferase n=1 Tax=uncultured Maribacter sp. TaxID=431308 RepID=UPI0026068719|nr:alpha-1,2-fucosyltransferase [uncultured Maribacter sp.]
MKIIQAQGQTCNQFWIYSHFIAEAIENKNKVWALAPDISIKDYPNLLDSDVIKYKLYSKFLVQLFGYKNYINVINSLVHNRITRTFLIFFFKLIPFVDFIWAEMEGFTFLNRDNYKKEICQILKPKDEITKNVETFFQTKREKFDIIIGVHLRRGDYATWQGGQYFYSDKEYNNVMLHLKTFFPSLKVGFLLCSNESLNPSNFEENDVFKLNNSSAAMDIYGLSQCDYIIGPPSSFSSWSAYFGNKPLYFLKTSDCKFNLSDFKTGENSWTKRND